MLLPCSSFPWLTQPHSCLSRKLQGASWCVKVAEPEGRVSIQLQKQGRIEHMGQLARGLVSLLNAHCFVGSGPAANDLSQHQVEKQGDCCAEGMKPLPVLPTLPPC